jgi:hypothetical protein
MVDRFTQGFSVTDFIYVGFCCSSRIVLCVLMKAILIGERAYRALRESQKAAVSDGSEMFVLRKLKG